MARTEIYRVSGPRQVHILTSVLIVVEGIAQGVQALKGGLLQLVDFHTHLFLLLGGHSSKVCHYGIDFTLLAQVLQAQRLYLLGIGCRHFRHLLKEAFNLLKYHVKKTSIFFIPLFLPAPRCSRIRLQRTRQQQHTAYSGAKLQHFFENRA